MALFKAGDNVIIRDSRKGTFKGIVVKDFDSDKDEWYDIVLNQPFLQGMANVWEKGQHIPCRRGISEVRKEAEDADSSY